MLCGVVLCGACVVLKVADGKRVGVRRSDFSPFCQREASAGGHILADNNFNVCVELVELDDVDHWSVPVLYATSLSTVEREPTGTVRKRRKRRKRNEISILLPHEMKYLFYCLPDRKYYSVHGNYMDSETNLAPLGHYASTMGPAKHRLPRSYERIESRHQTHPPHGTSCRPIRSRTFDACSRQGHHR